jgi:hypothetical protein
MVDRDRYIFGKGATQMTETKSILAEAEGIIYGDRERTYGNPGRNLRVIADYWTVLFGVKVSPEKVALAMVLLKVAREQHQHKRDNLVDGAGYLALIERIQP